MPNKTASDDNQDEIIKLSCQPHQNHAKKST